MVGMTAMHAITRKFEFKRERKEVLNPMERRRFKDVDYVERVFGENDAITTEEDIVVEQMVGDYAAIIKTFWSATYLDARKR